MERTGDDMNIRRFIPYVRTIALTFSGATAGLFVATGIAALAFGFVPARLLQISSTVVAYTGMFAVVAVRLLDRRLYKPRSSQPALLPDDKRRQRRAEGLAGDG